MAPLTPDGAIDRPWEPTTPSGRGTYLAWSEPDAQPPVLVVQVGRTVLHDHLACLEDVHAMLVEHGDWMELGSKDEGQETEPDTVEAWGRADDNPVGGWYGLKKGLRGRFANYVTPILVRKGLACFEKRGRAMGVTATSA